MPKIKLKKNETFYIREGWFEKGINTIEESENNVFFKNEGIKYLGIGSNMVKSLKYWMKAAGLITDDNNSLSEFGKILISKDRYLDTNFSWLFIHYFLSVNQEECPIFNLVFNSGIESFTKAEMYEYLLNQILAVDKSINRKNIEADLNIFIKSYVDEDKTANPENNYVCPLSALKLMKKEKSDYKLLMPQYSSLSYLIVYYALEELYGKKSFVIEESMNTTNSPVKIFNLDKYVYLQYLEDMRKSGLVTINKTAGLNTVYFEKPLTLREVFGEYFEASI